MKKKAKKKILSLPKDELCILAKKLKIKGVSQKTKDELIYELLKSDLESEIYKELDISWWNKSNNKLTFILTASSLIIGIIGVIISLIIFQNPSKEEIAENKKNNNILVIS